MRWCGLAFYWNRLRLLFLLIAFAVMLNLIVYAPLAPVALAQVPLEAQTETLQNSLRKSFPQEFPSHPKAPEVIDETRPTRKAPAAAPKFFLNKIFNSLIIIDKESTRVPSKSTRTKDFL